MGAENQTANSFHNPICLTSDNNFNYFMCGLYIPLNKSPLWRITRNKLVFVNIVQAIWLVELIDKQKMVEVMSINIEIAKIHDSRSTELKTLAVISLHIFQMGNKTSSNNSRKLKIAKYPSNIAEDQWIASGNNNIQNQEVKFISSKIDRRIRKVDRRIRAEPDDYKDWDIDEKQTSDNTYNYKNQINNIVQLRIQFAHKLVVGSGVIIHHTLYRTFVLTAA
eukprot:84826_1